MKESLSKCPATPYPIRRDALFAPGLSLKRFLSLINSCRNTPRFHKLALLSFGLSGGLSFFTLLMVLMFRLSREGMDPSVVGKFAYAGLPYTLRFLWPFVIDHVPVPGRSFWGPRKAWGIWAHVLSTTGFLALGALPLTSPFGLLFGIAFATAFFASVQDIVSDACRFEPRRTLPLEDSVTFQTMGFRGGQFLASSAVPLLAKLVGWFGAHLSVVFVKIFALFALLCLPEPSVFAPKDRRLLSAADGPSDGNPNVLKASLPTPISLLRQVLKKPHLITFLSSIVLLRALDTILGPLQTIFLGQLGLSNDLFGGIKSGLGFVGTLTGVMLAGRYVKRYAIFRLLRLGVVAESGAILLSLIFLQLSVTDAIFPFVFGGIVFVQEICLGLMNTLIVLYISSFCERFVGIYHFTLFSAFSSLVRTLGTHGFSVIQSVVGWDGLFICPLAFSLCALAVLGYLSSAKLELNLSRH